MARCVVFWSGGGASYVASKLAIEEFGKENVVNLFADTMMEDEDLYRFNREASAFLGVPITRVCEGRTPWEVFFSERMMGNTRADHCSRILKRDELDAWLVFYGERDDVLFIGMDANEEHRLAGVQKRLAPQVVRSPLIERGLWKEQVLKIIEADGLVLPRLYRMGFPHNNCGGFCIKAGQGHYANLLEKMPDRYAEHEGKEQAFRRFVRKDVSILRDRTGGETKPLTLQALRERIERTPAAVDKFDIGGCNCMTPPEENP